MNTEAIFELVDVTDEESYQPVGIFSSIESAIKSVEAQAEPWTLSDEAQYSDYCRLELMERKIGFSGQGRKVHEWSWGRVLDADGGESWKAHANRGADR